MHNHGTPGGHVANATQVVAAYNAAGLGNPDQAGRQISFGSPMTLAGDGFSVLVALPCGQTFDQAVNAREGIASGLGVSPSRVAISRASGDHHHWLRVKPSARPLWASELVGGMPYTELAVALSASDMPHRKPEALTYPEPDQIAAWVEQGVERLGGEIAVWRHVYDRFRFIVSVQDKKTLSPEDRAEFRRWIPNQRRDDRAHALAYRLGHALEAAGVVRNFPSRLVEVGYCEDLTGEYYGGTIMEWVPIRDLEMVKRESAAQLPVLVAA